jgi:hypothetical protein
MPELSFPFPFEWGRSLNEVCHGLFEAMTDEKLVQSCAVRRILLRKLDGFDPPKLGLNEAA